MSAGDCSNSAYPHSAPRRFVSAVTFVLYPPWVMTVVWETPTQRELNNCSVVERTSSPDLPWAVGFDDELQAAPAGSANRTFQIERPTEAVEVLRGPGSLARSIRTGLAFVPPAFVFQEED